MSAPDKGWCNLKQSFLKGRHPLSYRSVAFWVTKRACTCRILSAQEPRRAAVSMNGGFHPRPGCTIPGGGKRCRTPKGYCDRKIKQRWWRCLIISEGMFSEVVGTWETSRGLTETGAEPSLRIRQAHGILASAGSLWPSCTFSAYRAKSYYLWKKKTFRACAVSINNEFVIVGIQRKRDSGLKSMVERESKVLDTKVIWMLASEDSSSHICH